MVALMKVESIAECSLGYTSDSVARRPSVRPSTFSNICSSETTGPIELKYHGVLLGWGNESLFKWSWPHDQDGRHAHIW